MALSIPYATIQDVESRLGYALEDTEEIRKTNAFLEDFSLVIFSSFQASGKSVETASEQMLKMVTARRTAEWVLTSELLPGQTAFTETVGDRSISGTVTAGASRVNQLQLTSEERSLLGLKSSKMYSIRMIAEEPYRG